MALGEASVGVLVVEKLKIESNPFVAGPGGGRVGRPLQKTLGEVIRQIGNETPVVVVFGSPGTGKTLLAKTAKRACEDMGLSVRRIARGDVVDVAAGQRSDVLMLTKKWKSLSVYQLHGYFKFIRLKKAGNLKQIDKLLVLPPGELLVVSGLMIGGRDVIEAGCVQRPECRHDRDRFRPTPP
jgi:hypothetical protein